MLFLFQCLLRQEIDRIFTTVDAGAPLRSMTSFLQGVPLFLGVEILSEEYFTIVDWQVLQVGKR